jgi:tripartite ATP-independent transporter DctP family solute receptor
LYFISKRFKILHIHTYKLFGGKNVRKGIGLFYLVIFAMILSGCSSEQINGEKETDRAAYGTKGETKIVFKLAELHGGDYPTSLANKEFARMVRERTNGRIQIEEYADGALGEEIDVIEQLQYGTIGFARVSIAPMAEFSDKLNALMMPYLYEDGVHMWKVLNSSLGAEMLQSVSAAGMVGLAWYDSGARSFYLKHRIDTLEELARLKIRVQTSSLMFAMGETLGAIPKTIPESQIYMAVQNGTIDGAENNILTYESFAQYEVCKYFILNEHTRIPDILVGSETALQNLDKTDMEIIKACAKETQEYERKLWEESESEARTNLEKKGVTFVELSEDAKQAFRDACEPLYLEFALGYEDIIVAIQEMADK